MRKEIASLIFSTCFEIVIWVLPYMIPTMPNWLTISLLIIGGLGMLGSVVAIFWPSKKKQAITATSSVSNPPVVKAEGQAKSAGRDIVETNYFLPNSPTNNLVVQTDIIGNISLSPIVSKHGTIVFVVANDTNTNLLKCAVYVDEISYKLKKSKWESVGSLPSAHPLRWDDRFVYNGMASIDGGHKKSFFLLTALASLGKQDSIETNYYLDFYKQAVELPFATAPEHRILVRFCGSSLLGEKVDSRYYIFISENKAHFKKYDHLEICT